MEQALNGLLSNLGVFAPVAALGWWIIRTLRDDLVKQRDEARKDLAESREWNERLTERVITLCQSVERTMAELTAAIREGRQS